MSTPFDKVIAWDNRSDYTSLDLGIFRIIYSVAALVMLPNYFWISRFDSAFYRPAPGPLTLVTDFPPGWALASLDVVIAAALALLLVGFRTLPVSVILSVALLVGDGFSYSFGKIDHSILFVLAPLFLGLAGWGNSVSLDARVLRGGQGDVNHWAIRAFAVTIGVAFVTAAVPKTRGGWLSPSTQAAYAYVVQKVERGRSQWLAPFAADLNFPHAWELFDWATVLFEGGLILCALSWPMWRLGLCAAVLFHVGVLLTLNIDFWMNIVAYGAFVRWSHVPGAFPRPAAVRGTRRTWDPSSPPAAPVLVALAGLIAAGQFTVVHRYGPLTGTLGWVPVLVAMVIAIWYLVVRVRSGVTALRPSFQGEGEGNRRGKRG